MILEEGDKPVQGNLIGGNFKYIVAVGPVLFLLANLAKIVLEKYGMTMI